MKPYRCTGDLCCSQRLSLFLWLTLYMWLQTQPPICMLVCIFNTCPSAKFNSINHYLHFKVLYQFQFNVMNCNVYFILQFPIVQTCYEINKNYWYLKYLKKNKMSATLHKLERYYVSFLYTVNEKVPECFSSSFVRTFFIFFFRINISKKRNPFEVS